MEKIQIVDSLKDRDFNDDGIPDMYLEEGSNGKKQFAWKNPEAKAVWDKYIRYNKGTATYFLDQAAVMVDVVKATNRQAEAIEAQTERLDLICTSTRRICNAICDLGEEIAKIKISIF